MIDECRGGVQFLAALISTAPIDQFDLRNSLIDDATVNRFCADNWQVLPHILKRLSKLRDKVSGNLDWEILSNRALALQRHAELSVYVLDEVTNRMLAEGLDHCVVKGAAYRQEIYPEPSDRALIDVDLAITKPDVEAVEKILADCDFHQSKWDPSIRRFVKASESERLSLRNQHYELGFIVRRERYTALDSNEQEAIIAQLALDPNPWHLIDDSNLAAYINIDAHTGLSLDIPTIDLLREKRRPGKESSAFHVPPNHWLAFHTIFKLYWEGVHKYRKGAYQFVDLQHLLEQMSLAEFQKLETLLEQFNLTAAALYCLQRLSSSLGQNLDDYVLDFIDRSRSAPDGSDPMQANDLGDMWPKLFGFISFDN